MPLWTQVEMQQGFQMLENGQFAEAEVFFADVIKDAPENKTAQLCYGRALGLNSSPSAAVEHFNWMEEKYPGDSEIRINKAEAFLWSNQSGEALKLFKELYNADSTNFAITLGYANTLSIEKSYAKALEMINRALQINDNPQALISKKYILLGLSEDAKNKEDYTKAHSYLDTIETDRINDREVLLSRGTLYLIQENYNEAHAIYKKMLDYQIDFSDAALGVSYTSMILNDRAESIEWAERVLLTAQSNKDTLLMQRSSISLINALGADKEFKQAFETLSRWEEILGSNMEFTMAKIRLTFWKGEINKAISRYQELLEVYPDHYGLRVGIAEVLYADQKHKEAISQLNHIIEIYPQKRDARILRNRILNASKPIIVTNVNHMKDNGGNQSREYTARFQFNNHSSISPFIQLNSKSTQQNQEALTANRTDLRGGILYNPNSRFHLDAFLGLQRSSSFLSENLKNTLVALNLSVKPLVNHSIGFSIESNSLDYNAEMIRSNTRVWKFSGNYFTTIANQWGIYIQGGRSSFSDQNSNHWAFMSFYYQFKKLKGWKSGLNMSYTGFEIANKDLYFSPEKFMSGEIFIQYQKPFITNQRLSFMAECAIGVQGNNNTPWQRTFRWSSALVYKLNPWIETRASLMGSNSATENASGYAYQAFNLSFHFLLGN